MPSLSALPSDRRTGMVISASCLGTETVALGTSRLTFECSAG
jgi:hypothetical protein